MLDSIVFRPLKTKQDIEREEAIAEMIDLVDFKEISSFNQELLKICEITCNQLYKAGYHNGVKVGEKVSVEELRNSHAYNLIPLDTLKAKFDIFRKLES